MEKMYCISHMADFDGVGSAALIMRKFKISRKALFFSGYSKKEFEDAKNSLLKKKPANSTIMIVDLGIDESHAKEVIAFWRKLVEKGNRIVWLDHHKCSDELAKKASIYLYFGVFGENKAYCASEIIYELFLKGDKIAEKIKEFAHITDFHLYKEGSIYQKVSAAITRISYEKNWQDLLRKLAEEVSKGRIENSIVDKFYAEYANEEREELEKLKKNMIVDDLFALGFGRRLESNKACDMLKAWSGKEIAIYINTEKGKVSIRSEHGEAFLIGLMLKGGGHDNAAGAELSNIGGRRTEDLYRKIKEIVRKAKAQKEGRAIQ